METDSFRNRLTASSPVFNVLEECETNISIASNNGDRVELSPLEWSVVEGVGTQGKSDSELAIDSGVDRHFIKKAVLRVYDKFEIRGEGPKRTMLIRELVQRGFLEFKPRIENKDTPYG